MKKLTRKISDENTVVMISTIELMRILNKIKELDGYLISIESDENTCTLHIGSSKYEIGF